jgi:hypothetical protein
MACMQIITGSERRRAWSEEQKRAIVSAAFALGRLSLMSPVALTFVPDRSIGGGKSCAALVAASPKW